MRELFPRIGEPKKELIGALELFLLLLIAFLGLALIINLVDLNDLDKVGDVIASEKDNLLLFGIILAPALFLEEFFFRAFLVKRIGVFWSTLAFALAHFSYGSIAELIGVFFLGLILAYWYKKHNSLAQTYIAHILYDLVAIILYLVV